MKPSMESPSKTKSFLLVGTVILTVLTLCSFFVGKYPLTLSGLLSGDAIQWRVFLTLRASRAVIGAIGGFVLGVTGFVYQTVFRNPLASPDIIGASSGASVGAAFGILFLPGAVAVTLSAFAGAICCVLLALTLSSLTAEKDGKNRVSLSEAPRRPGKAACLHRILDYGKFKRYQPVFHRWKHRSVPALSAWDVPVVPSDPPALSGRSGGAAARRKCDANPPDRPFDRNSCRLQRDQHDRADQLYFASCPPRSAPALQKQPLIHHVVQWPARRVSFDAR